MNEILNEKELHTDELSKAIHSSFGERWNEVMQYPGTKDGLMAIARLIGNGVITAGDFVPIAGEFPSWGADLWKIVTRIAPQFREYDLSPDVGAGGAILTEGLEFVSGTVAPTHLYETVFQLKADIKSGKLKAGRDALAYLFTGQEGYKEALAQYSKELDDSAQVFEEA